jgi:hypothetical protein
MTSVLAGAGESTAVTAAGPPNNYQASPVKRIDLFRPVVVRSPRNGRRRVAAEPR